MRFDGHSVLIWILDHALPKTKSMSRSKALKIHGSVRRPENQPSGGGLARREGGVQHTVRAPTPHSPH